jgi:phenylacetic acid degradation protein
MPAYEFEGVRPVVDPTAFVHPTATLIGDVIIGAGCLIGPGASLRGDIGRIEIHDGANIQDNCTVHCFPGKSTVVEASGHIGHGAILHGCRIGRNALIGMNAVIMDDVVIGEESFVAAMAFVKAGMAVPPRTLVAGIPATALRELREQEITWKTQGTGVYQSLARRFLATMREVTPQTAIEPGRASLPLHDYVPKHDHSA